ncbi:AAA family ATPase [Nitrosomonas mobilis]|nr:AAA family ATPase [Nitrosomonas mobilis]
MADFKRFMTEEGFKPAEDTSTEEDFDALPESGKVITLLVKHSADAGSVDEAVTADAATYDRHEEEAFWNAQLQQPSTPAIADDAANDRQEAEGALFTVAGEPAPKGKEIFRLTAFNITRDATAMREKMLDDVFIMDGIALRGQLTALYAAPNTGKTLLTIRMLADSVTAGRIRGENVYYINADDNDRGLVDKADIFAKYGMNLIAPEHRDFKVRDFVGMLRLMVEQDTARGEIIVLDTLKKFTSLMDKKISSAFMSVARTFASHGGSMILLAHTNKRRDVDGSLIHGGTSDVVDDSDCVYIIDGGKPALGDTTRTVIFENTKSRGNVEREVCFSYSIGEHCGYGQLVESVKRLSQGDLVTAKAKAEAAELLEKDSYLIGIIQEVIPQGAREKTNLIKAASAAGGGSVHKIRAVLDRYTGKFWGATIGARNSHSYHLIGEQATEEAYKHQTNGN